MINNNVTDNKWSVIAPFFVGVAVGAAVAVIVAPKSGRRLREDIAGKVNQGIKRGKDATSDLVNQATRLTDQVQQEVQRVRDAVDAGTRAYRRAANNSSSVRGS